MSYDVAGFCAKLNNFYPFGCRLKKEYDLLEKFLEEETDLKEIKEYEQAQLVLSDAKEVLEKEQD